MEAQAWTAIGLLAATLLGSLFYLGNRIDSVGAKVDGRMDSLGAKLDGRMDGLTDRLDSLGARLDARIDHLSGRLDHLSGRLDALSDRVEDQGREFAAQMFEHGVKLDEHLRHHTQ